ncbi:MAG: methyltransferase domain-containing protein [Planktothrix agardhii KL2]|jgi:SAM-dependent methyltransferase|uniref:class I SAM-dependent methyltransferase n=1 Tax=Planktothrix agardhii TaxID=1160 RepID=UPI001A26E697|nr:class I SAM-dependent methyltransferase [Planktothrix agardhii]MBG0748123.1 methyltransferase domain-containing protein [Planktothrix agardhii KL2]CAD5935859.1 C-methyltransferase NovU [Planktothrix agardhii]
MRSECRFCSNLLSHTFVDLGMSPLSNAYLKLDTINKAEKFYPLHTYVCDNCFLVQLEEFETPDHIFSDYAYFSSYSETWLRHAENYTELMTQRFSLNANSQVIEIASNDGYLLQYFQKQNIPVLGIEPAANVAKVAEEKGIPSLVKFFGVSTAKELVAQGKQADLLLGNNVLAHVPNLNDFVAGMKIVLKPDGILTMEFPHVLQLILQNQFDTIYHEHFSYFSFLTVDKVFATHGLTLFDVEELPTHGGSLRIYGQHNDGKQPVSDRVSKLKTKEIEAGLEQRSTYLGFGEQVKATKRHLLSFLIDIKNQGKSVVGYGAPAKGNTLLNYCGIRTDLLDYTVDRSPYKQGLFLPGTHISIYHPDKIIETKPDYLLILPWNIKDEIIEQMSHIREWGGQFVVPIPQVEVIA